MSLPSACALASRAPPTLRARVVGDRLHRHRPASRRSPPLRSAGIATGVSARIRVTRCDPRVTRQHHLQSVAGADRRHPARDLHRPDAEPCRPSVVSDEAPVTVAAHRRLHGSRPGTVSGDGRAWATSAPPCSRTTIAGLLPRAAATLRRRRTGRTEVLGWAPCTCTILR